MDNTFTREDAKKLIDDTLTKRERENQFQVNQIPYHTHSGVDSPDVENGFAKVSENGFITAYNKAFAASSSTTGGTFGQDWFLIYCERDSVPTGAVAVNTASLEAPYTDRILLKKSGPSPFRPTANYGMMMRIQGGSPSKATGPAGPTYNGAGVIDINYPLALGVYSSDPDRPPTMNQSGTTAPIEGTIYYNDSSSQSVRVFRGASTGWSNVGGVDVTIAGSTATIYTNRVQGTGAALNLGTNGILTTPSDFNPTGSGQDLGSTSNSWAIGNIDKIQGNGGSNVIDLSGSGSIKTNQSYLPSSDAAIDVGSNALRWNLIRGVTITPGDIVFENDWKLREYPASKEDVGKPIPWMKENANEGIQLLDDQENVVAVFTRHGIYGDFKPLSALSAEQKP